MKQAIKDMFPAWTNEKLERDLVLSNDLDSLLGCTLLHMIFGYIINGYYSFNNGLGLIDTKNIKKLLGVDICFAKDFPSWDNHVSKINRDAYVNPNSANLNAILGIHAGSRQNYYKKMAFSTALQIWSYYDMPLPDTDEGKMLLLSIDSSYLGFYDNRFKSTWLYYMEILEFDELIDFCKRHSKSDFIEFKKQYTEQIHLIDGYIYYDDASKQFVEDCLGFKLYIPTEKFIQYVDVESDRIPLHKAHDIITDKKLLSYAIINASEMKYSMMLNVNT